MKNELLFENLFARALKDWPEEITFGKLIRYESPRFIIEGLGDLSDEIEHRYINHPEEIIMRNMHHCIYGELHDLAKKSLKEKMQDLNSEIVKKDFEDSLKYGLANPENLNWSPRSIKMAKEYFEVNYPSSDITP